MYGSVLLQKHSNGSISITRLFPEKQAWQDFWSPVHFCQSLSSSFPPTGVLSLCPELFVKTGLRILFPPPELEGITMRNSLIQDGLPPPTPPGALLEGGPTFLGGITHDDLAAPLAGLLHRQRCAQALLMLPETLAFPEAVLLHDFMCYRAPARRKRRKVPALGSSATAQIRFHITISFWEERMQIPQGCWWCQISTNGLRWKLWDVQEKDKEWMPLDYLRWRKH